jgi:hypothetical protein
LMVLFQWWQLCLDSHQRRSTIIVYHPKHHNHILCGTNPRWWPRNFFIV